jgi:hypothetical protein
MKRMLILTVLLMLLLGLLPIQNIQAQDPCTGLGAASRIKPNEQVTINFFKADPNGRPVGDALTPEQIEAGFKVGDAVAIRVSAQYCFYIYVVNVSEWDDTSLQYPSEASENVGIQAGGTKELGFRLENISHRSSTTGREELLVLVTKNKISSPDLQTVLSNAGQIKLTQQQVSEGRNLLRNTLTEASSPVPSSTTANPASNTTATSPPPNKSNKFIKVVSVGCKVASIFFPFARIACAAGGFGAARYIKAEGNAIAVAPTADTNQLVFRFSFPVQP